MCYLIKIEISLIDMYVYLPIYSYREICAIIPEDYTKGITNLFGHAY